MTVKGLVVFRSFERSGLGRGLGVYNISLPRSEEPESSCDQDLYPS